MSTPSERVQRLREERTFQVVLFDPAPRWSEEATEKVLDLVARVLDWDPQYDPPQREALAVLDALDPQEAK